MLCTAVRYLRANDMPGRLVMETGGFWGMFAACPKPVLGLPYSFVRLPPLFRGVSPLAWLGPHSFLLFSPVYDAERFLHYDRLGRVFHMARAGGLAPRTLTVLHEYASGPHGSVRPSRMATP